MWPEIAGVALLWVLGTIAVGEWLALAKLNTKYENLEIDYDRLMADHARLIKLYKTEK